MKLQRYCINRPNLYIKNWSKYLKKTHKTLIIFVACIGTSFAAQPTEESQILINNLLQQVRTTMTAVATAEREAGNSLENLNFTLEIPAGISPNLGLVLDVNDPQGFKVLSVSPGSVADKLSISPNSLITAINGKNTYNQNRDDAFTELENAMPGDMMKIKLVNDGQIKTLDASIDGQYTPAIHIEIRGDDLNNQSNTSTTNIDKADNACGVVSVFNKPPITRDLHFAKVTQIDEDGVNRQRVNFILPVGKHIIHVQEFISDSMFRRRSFSVQDAKTIEIDIKPNTTYHLAAKFNRKLRNEQKNGDYWDPVVWKTQTKACEL